MAADADRPDARSLVHQVNNFLGVVQTQIAVSEAVGTPEAARQALAQIGRDADRLAEFVKAFRRNGGAAAGAAPQDGPSSDPEGV